MAATSIKPLNLPDVTCGKLRQYVTVSPVDFSHWRCAFFADVDVGLVMKSSFGAAGNIHNANTDAGKWPSDNVIAIPMVVVHLPMPCHLIQTVAQLVGR